MTTTPVTPAAIEAALASMTPSATAFMRLVGDRRFDFFDDGIVEGSGNWGRHMAQQAASMMGKAPRSMGGIMARMSELELWVCEDQGADMSGNPSDTVWWTLTALGAAVANELAGQAVEAPAVEEAPASSAKPQGSHAACSHPSTKAARATCRRARAKGEAVEAAPVEADPITERVATREQELDDAYELEADDADVLAELDADAYADAVIAELGGQQ